MEFRLRHLSPTTLTVDEQRAILAATAGHPRDHLIFYMALGTGLRLAELVGLNVGDVCGPAGVPKVRARVRVRVRRGIAKGGRAAGVFLPDRLVTMLRKYWAWKRRRGESVDPGQPLFCNQSRERVSKRRVQDAWRGWQREAEFERLYPFRRLRHSAVTNVYRATRDLFLTQRFSRHASPLTTTVYTHPSDEEPPRRSANLSC